jgi:hypothetical protein
MGYDIVRRGISSGKVSTHKESIHRFCDEATERDFLQVLMYAEVALRVYDVPGDFVECGVASGTSFKWFVRTFKRLQGDRGLRVPHRCYGFDSFRGLPTLSDKDTPAASGKREVDMIEGGFDSSMHLSDLRQFCNCYGNAELIQGWFDTTIPEFLSKNQHMAVSLLHIDCDIYESTKSSLEGFIRRVPPGGVILFDEIFHPNYPGEAAAFWDVFDVEQLPARFRFERVKSVPSKWFLLRES